MAQFFDLFVDLLFYYGVSLRKVTILQVADLVPNCDVFGRNLHRANFEWLCSYLISFRHVEGDLFEAGLAVEVVCRRQDETRPD
jgi:hypothetical protein